MAALYDGFNAADLQYGPGYRTLSQAWGGSDTAVARLLARATREGAAVHPADLDAALCVGALASRGEGGGETRLPFAVDDALLQRGGAGESWAVRGRAASARGPARRRLTRSSAWLGRIAGDSACYR